jgi:hypothetical protein
LFRLVWTACLYSYIIHYSGIRLQSSTIITQQYIGKPAYTILQSVLYIWPAGRVHEQSQSHSALFLLVASKVWNAPLRSSNLVDVDDLCSGEGKCWMELHYFFESRDLPHFHCRQRKSQRVYRKSRETCGRENPSDQTRQPTLTQVRRRGLPILLGLLEKG